MTRGELGFEGFEEPFESIPVPVWTAGPDGRHRWGNLAWCRLTGTDPRERRSEAWLERVPSADRASRLAAWDRAITRACEYEASFRMADGRGEEAWLVETAAPRSASGRLLGFVGSTVDHSESRRAERRNEEYRRRLRAMTSELFHAHERERRSLAQDLHDGLCQVLALARLRIGSLRASRSPDEEAFDELESLLGRAERSARNAMFELSPPVLHQLGLDAALRRLGEELHERYRMAVEFEGSGPTAPAGEKADVTLFRAAREALINVARHAGILRAEVRLSQESGRVRIEVEDRGRGFEPAEEGLAGHGLFGVRERLEHIGGALEVSSRPGAGTRVLILGPPAWDARAGGGSAA